MVGNYIELSFNEFMRNSESICLRYESLVTKIKGIININIILLDKIKFQDKLSEYRLHQLAEILEIEYSENLEDDLTNQYQIFVSRCVDEYVNLHDLFFKTYLSKVDTKGVDEYERVVIIQKNKMSELYRDVVKLFLTSGIC